MKNNLILEQLIQSLHIENNKCKQHKLSSTNERDRVLNELKKYSQDEINEMIVKVLEQTKSKYIKKEAWQLMNR